MPIRYLENAFLLVTNRTTVMVELNGVRLPPGVPQRVDMPGNLEDPEWQKLLVGYYHLELGMDIIGEEHSLFCAMLRMLLQAQTFTVQTTAPAVQNLAELRALGPSQRWDKMTRLVEDNEAIWRYDSQSFAVPVPGEVEKPDDIPPTTAGRWFRIENGVHAFTHLQYGIHASDPLSVGIPVSVGLGANLEGSLDNYVRRDHIHRHSDVRQLIHFLDDGPAEGLPSTVREVLPPGDPFPTTVRWRKATGELVLEKTITRNAAQLPTQVVWQVYDDAGALVVATVTDTITLSGPFETSRTRTVA